MTKFLIKGSYSPEGVKGLRKAGGSARKEAVGKMIKDMGGKMESFYYAFGESDVFVIAEMPDAASVAATSLAINSTGMVSVSATILVTPEEIDKASNMTVNYRSPGA
jgi:uncharacterized protein with GYD domain